MSFTRSAAGKHNRESWLARRSYQHPTQPVCLLGVAMDTMMVVPETNGHTAIAKAIVVCISPLLTVVFADLPKMLDSSHSVFGCLTRGNGLLLLMSSCLRLRGILSSIRQGFSRLLSMPSTFLSVMPFHRLTNVISGSFPDIGFCRFNAGEQGSYHCLQISREPWSFEMWALGMFA